MRRNIITLVMILVTAAAAFASRHGSSSDDDATSRAKWMQEMQQHQNDFIAKELELTDKQRADFLPLYNEMRKEIIKASKETRDMAKAVKKKGSAATDADYEAATKAYLDSRAKEAEITRTYYKKFSHILSKRQLFRLEATERKFDRVLIQHHGNAEKSKKKKERD